MFFEKVRKIAVVWTIGLLGKLALFILKRDWKLPKLVLKRRIKDCKLLIKKYEKRIEVCGYREEKLDHKGRGLIIICNHISLWEPFVLIFLVTSLKRLFSLRHIPRIVADKKNFQDKWYFLFFRPFIIAVDREDMSGGEEAAKKIRSVVNNGGIVILFPEAGRTENWIKVRGVKYSSSGKYRIARFPLGIRKIFLGLSCFVLPTWSEGGDRIIPNEVLPTRVRVAGRTVSKNKKLVMLMAIFPRFWRKSKVVLGDPLEVSSIPVDEIIERLQNALLDTAEQGGQK